MQNTDCLGKAHRIYPAIRIASEILHDFKDTRPCTPPWLGARMLRIKLREGECHAYSADDWCRKVEQIAF